MNQEKPSKPKAEDSQKQLDKYHEELESWASAAENTIEALRIENDMFLKEIEANRKKIMFLASEIAIMADTNRKKQ